MARFLYNKKKLLLIALMVFAAGMLMDNLSTYTFMKMDGSTEDELNWNLKEFMEGREITLKNIFLYELSVGWIYLMLSILGGLVAGFALKGVVGFKTYKESFLFFVLVIFLLLGAIKMLAGVINTIGILIEVLIGWTG